MGDSSTKKRKSAHLEAEDTHEQRRQKIRILDNAANEAGIPGDPTVERATKDGKSRQEKSERRSSKKRKKLAADTSPAKEADGDNIETKPKRVHNKHENANAEERDDGQLNGNILDQSSELSSKKSKEQFVPRKPTAKISDGSGAPAPANDNSLPVTNRIDEARGKNKNRIKATTEQATKNEITPKESTTEGQNNSKLQRFILFIGNLPYSATTPQIESHFSNLAPTSIRHSTDKSTGRSKGFAFLEFSGYDKMKTCLKLYHHSVFDPERSKDDPDNERKDMKKSGRRINVELTVGGGGRRSEKRKEKIKGKNLKLEEERGRRRVKELEDGEKKASKKTRKTATVANATLKTEKEDDKGDIHPSRRGRVG